MEIVIVRPGDSLWSIASRYGTSAEELARINQSLTQSLSPEEDDLIYALLLRIDKNFKP